MTTASNDSNTSTAPTASMTTRPSNSGAARPSLSRRGFLAGAAALAASATLPRRAWAATEEPVIWPRDDWGAHLPPQGDLYVEHDVRFLLLHHSASSNAYAPGDVAGIIASFYHWHTGHHGWADIAYNYLVDRYGNVWEGREGTHQNAIQGDAVGGSQGFAILCCFIGDHRTEPPTEAAQESMVGLCAGLSLRYGIDPEGRTGFVSRGSNRWPEGTWVETATVAGHRDMSLTSCPGDTGYQLVTEDFPPRIAAAMEHIGS